LYDLGKSKHQRNIESALREEMGMAGTLLAVYAHPDDEVFGVGGTLAHYSALGMKTILVCATRGEVGEISDPTLATAETLAEVREQELRCACERLGVNELIFLDYRDSGMDGTPENEDPRCFVKADPQEAIGKLVAIIRREKPQVVLTFEPFGGYGHPDHKAASRWTTAAFDAAVDPTQYPEAGPGWQAERLFYSTIPTSFFMDLQAAMEAAGMDTDQFRRIGEMPDRFPDEKITTVVEVGQFAERKWEAAMCHATQFGDNNIFRKMPDELKVRMASREYFAQIKPDPSESAAPVDDLFAGLEVAQS
jgi:LmbE family N-acetylglucosaminyl deacetylase